MLITFFIYSAKCAAVVDTTIGLTAPKDVCKDYKTLARYVCDNQTGDQAKVNAIYNWITHNIKYDVKTLSAKELKTVKVEKGLKKKKGICEGYTRFFTAKCLALCD